MGGSESHPQQNTSETLSPIVDMLESPSPPPAPPLKEELMDAKQGIVPMSVIMTMLMVFVLFVKTLGDHIFVEGSSSFSFCATDFVWRFADYIYFTDDYSE